MSFIQIEFFIFLPVLVFISNFMKNNTVRKLLLLFASYYFYAYWDARFMPLLLVPTFVDYSIGRIIGNPQKKYIRKTLLVFSVLTNIGILALFKYYNFFIDTFSLMMQPLGINLQTITLILPLGISFYTFSTLTYTIEIYRGNIQPCDSLLDYALFIAFFPKLVAGPISWASYLLPQFKKRHEFDSAKLMNGISLFISGLFLKVFFADNLSLFVSTIFDAPSVYNSLTLWCGAIAFSLQIYFDFAGYSQMAIGIAAMLGYDIETNFDFPYLSTNISAFWRRWHITLSYWIRDYIYIPLGGNRRGHMRKHLNLLIAMALCGLWHGAAWTFVLWGVYHGGALVVRRIKLDFQKDKERVNTAFQQFVNWLLTMIVIILGWVIFRAENFASALSFLKGMFSFQTGIRWVYPFFIFTLLTTIFVHIIHLKDLSQAHLLPREAWYTPFLILCLLWLIVIFKAEGFNPFIYQQF